MTGPRDVTAEPQGSRSLFSHSAFLRLWAVGGVSNAVLWLEILAASLFTLEVTGSAAMVAVVSAARAAPLIVLGAVAGIASDAWSRKRIVVAGLVLSALVAALVAALAVAGLIRPWHLAVAALASGCVYATEMPARRRMVAESGGPDQIDRAVALDGLTGYLARCIGPLVAGAVYQRFGLAGAYGCSALCSLAGLAVLVGRGHRQSARPLRLAGLSQDFGEAWRFARRSPRILMLLAVTVTMNLFGYSYSTLMVPFSQSGYGLDATMTGLVAAAEPAGAFLAGLVLTRLTLSGDRLVLLGAGVVILACGLLLAGLAACWSFTIAPVMAVLVLGGTGCAIYTNQQTGIVVADVPPALRSRVMGLVTVAIGSWPFGMLLAGGLARWLTPAAALVGLATLALVSIGGIGLVALAGLRRPLA